MRWEKVGPEWWESGDYVVWVQAHVREGMSTVREYAAQFKDESPFTTWSHTHSW
jgi:hypothetical protein